MPASLSGLVLLKGVLFMSVVWTQICPQNLVNSRTVTRELNHLMYLVPGHHCENSQHNTKQHNTKQPVEILARADVFSVAAGACWWRGGGGSGGGTSVCTCQDNHWF